MKWVTYRGSDLGDGERAGVVSGETIYAAPRGVTLLDLMGQTRFVFARTFDVVPFPLPDEIQSRQVIAGEFGQSELHAENISP